MKTRFTLALAVALVWPLIEGSAFAAKNDPHQSGNSNAQDTIFQSSKLSDLNVYNQNDMNKKLGDVDDLIVNAYTGHVLYAILDTGVGGKSIPVPWTALQLHMPTNESNDKSKSHSWFTLNKTEHDLANAPTFDKNHRPDFTSQQWQQSVDNFFGVRNVARPQDVKGAGQLSANQLIFESSRLGDLNVYNRGDIHKKLGNLDNLLIDARSGEVVYGILDTGIGGKNIAVPWNAFQLEKAASKDQYWLTLNKTDNDLANAPTFDNNKDSQVTDPSWQQSVEKFFGVRTATRPQR